LVLNVVLIFSQCIHSLILFFLQVLLFIYLYFFYRTSTKESRSALGRQMIAGVHVLFYLCLTILLNIEFECRV